MFPFHSRLIVLYLTVMVGVEVIPRTACHGRLMDPPSRSSMWRAGFSTPQNYDDNALYCGGFSVQWQKYGGKCGLCGDPWTGPRENEPGGRYATGAISRKYQEGQVIDVYVQLTANHKGYFEFRMCQHNDPLTNITQACLDRHLLIVDSTGQTRYMISSDMKDVRLTLRLPPHLTCTACVLQWKYNAGNSWGVDLETHQGCIGCGPQEQFYGCADVAIGHDEIPIGVPPDRFPWHSSISQGTTTAGHPHQTQTTSSRTSWRYGIAYTFGSEGGGKRRGGKESGGAPLQCSFLRVWTLVMFCYVVC